MTQTGIAWKLTVEADGKQRTVYALAINQYYATKISRNLYGASSIVRAVEKVG